MRSELFPFHFAGLGGGLLAQSCVCVRNRPQPFTADSRDSGEFANSVLGPSLTTSFLLPCLADLKLFIFIDMCPSTFCVASAIDSQGLASPRFIFSGMRTHWRGPCAFGMAGVTLRTCRISRFVYPAPVVTRRVSNVTTKNREGKRFSASLALRSLCWPADALVTVSFAAQGMSQKGFLQR